VAASSKWNATVTGKVKHALPARWSTTMFWPSCSCVASQPLSW